jgi:hypothetical protein
MSLALLFRYLLLNMFPMLVHPLSGTCDLFVELFHGLYCSGSMCVGVTLWFGWGGVVSNLMSLALLFRYLLLNMFRMLIHPFSGACDLFVELFHGLYCSGSMDVGVTVWFGWGGVVSNLMSLALLFRYLMLNMFRMLIHPSSGACELFVELFHGLYCSGSMDVGVTLWFGWGGVVSNLMSLALLFRYLMLNVFRM